VLIFVFDNLLLWSLVPLLMAAADPDRQHLGATIRRIAGRVVTHPFNLATVVGILASYWQVTLPAAGQQIVTWLSGATAPCALFILGVTVGLRPLPRLDREVPALVFIKLIVHPLAAWVLLSLIGDFGSAWTHAAIIMAALPPAMNIFVVATQYHVGVERASACVLLGTLASMATLTGLLYLIKSGAIPYDLLP
jgi:predicted permease